ncbi:divalent metal cation transporter [Caulobacter segnis]
MSAIQLVSAQIGRVTGKGLAANLGEVMPRWAVNLLVVLLLAANTINIGANLAAMGAAAELLGPSWLAHLHRGLCGAVAAAAALRALPALCILPQMADLRPAGLCRGALHREARSGPPSPRAWSGRAYSPRRR